MIMLSLNPFANRRARRHMEARQREGLLQATLDDLDRIRKVAQTAGDPGRPSVDASLAIVRQLAADGATRLRRIVGGAAALVLVALMGGACSVQSSGLALVGPGQVDAAGEEAQGAPDQADAPPTPAAHPDAADAADVDRWESGPATPEGRTFRQCVEAMDPSATCDRCRDATGAVLSAPCRAALLCLGTDYAWTTSAVVGQPPDPIANCTTSQPVAACLRAAEDKSCQ